MNCIFCKIINKKQEADIVYEDEDFVCFRDIHPKAPVHLLVVPKKHIESVKSVGQGDRELLGGLVLTAKKVAQQKGLKGYKLLVNVGRKGGQVVDHLHMHLLADAN